jgi:hypothetical protein
MKIETVSMILLKFLLKRLFSLYEFHPEIAGNGHSGLQKFPGGSMPGVRTSDRSEQFFVPVSYKHLLLYNDQNEKFMLSRIKKTYSCKPSQGFRERKKFL